MRGTEDVRVNGSSIPEIPLYNASLRTGKDGHTNYFIV